MVFLERNSQLAPNFIANFINEYTFVQWHLRAFQKSYNSDNMNFWIREFKFQDRAGTSALLCRGKKIKVNK